LTDAGSIPDSASDGLPGLQHVGIERHRLHVSAHDVRHARERSSRLATLRGGCIGGQHAAAGRSGGGWRRRVIGRRTRFKRVVANRRDAPRTRHRARRSHLTPLLQAAAEHAAGVRIDMEHGHSLLRRGSLSVASKLGTNCCPARWPVPGGAQRGLFDGTAQAERCQY